MRLLRLWGLAALLTAVLGNGMAEDAPVVTKRVLTIGNSFSQSVFNFLPAMAKATPGVELKLYGANIGGCSIERHMKEWERSQADANHKPYSYTGADNKKVPANLRDMLRLQPWDAVIFQQFSGLSWKPESYEPFTEQLIALIREHAPTAEVLIQQTWAYRSDEPRLAQWGITPQEMYEALTESYRGVAARHGLRIVPVGMAVELSRERAQVPFKPVVGEALNAYRWPDLPSQACEVVGTMFWGKNKETGKMIIQRDAYHMNTRGAYMQSAVWFGFLFPEQWKDLAFVPGSIGDEDAAFLRQCARDALDGFAQAQAAANDAE